MRNNHENITSHTFKNTLNVINTTGSCILEDALNIWSKFEEQAQHMCNERYTPLSYMNYFFNGTESKDNTINRTSINEKDLNMSSKRFYSVMELLTDFISHHISYPAVNYDFEIKEIYDSNLNKKRDVKIHIAPALTSRSGVAIHLNVDYSRDTENKEGLPAPIVLVPYETIRAGLIKYVKEMFSNWEKDKNNSDYLTRNNSDHNDSNHHNRVKTVIIGCCKVLDKKFTLDYSYDHQSLVERIKKADFENAKSLFVADKILYNLSLEENQKQLSTFLMVNTRFFRSTGQTNQCQQLPKDLEKTIAAYVIGYPIKR